jgi:hypothetical protein
MGLDSKDLLRAEEKSDKKLENKKERMQDGKKRSK